mgnify:CR=1 FL=1
MHVFLNPIVNSEAPNSFKGVWISKEIWLDSKLNWTQKLLLVEIGSLDSHDKCFASNAHFAEFLGLSKSRVSEVISDLEKKGYIKCFLKYNGKQVIKRTIKVLHKVVSLPNTPGQFTDDPPSENSEGINTQDINNITEFTIPTPELVQAYKVEINAECSPNKFFDHHQSKGWVVGRGPMMCWKSAFRIWEANHHEFKKEREKINASRVSKGLNKNPKWLDINAAF